MKVCFDTYGCRLNRAEALEEEAKYLAAGYELTDEYEDADVIVVRGCSITARAQRKCEKVIARIRKRFPVKKLVIQGCLDKDLLTPVALGEIQGIKAKPLRAKNENGPGTHIVKERDDLPVVDMLHWRVPDRTARAYLKVQDGCSGQCTFCIVPKFRGKSVSVDFDEAIEKSRDFIRSGYREIVITGCNLSLYASKGKRLADLVEAIAELDDCCRVRVGSVEPGQAAWELVEAMSRHSNICRFLHLPVQSGSQVTLSAMKRPYTVKEVSALIRNALKLMPNLALGCDLMAGFPGESDLDYLSTKGFLQRHPFTNAHVFPYSERPGTPAQDFLEPIPQDVRSERSHELADIADRKRAAYAQRFVGKVVEIIVEDMKTVGGWTDEYLWCSAVNAKFCTGVRRKQRLRMRVKSTNGDRLVGMPLTEDIKTGKENGQ